MKEKKNEEDKSVANTFIDNYIGTVPKTALPKLPTLAKDSKEGGSNVKPKRFSNVQNNPSTICVVHSPPKPLYSSSNPELDKQGCDYAEYIDYEEGSDDLPENDSYVVKKMGYQN